MRAIIFIFCFWVLVGCKESTPERPIIGIETSSGWIKIELYPQAAPHTVSRFLQFVERDLFRNSSFYRVMHNYNQPSDTYKANIIQGGLWKTSAHLKDTLAGIPHESTKESGLSHKRWTVSLARNEAGTGTTEFFICLDDQFGYDYGGKNNPDGLGYAAFGKVIDGFDVVQKIYEMPDVGQYFDPPVKIFTIKTL